MHKLFQTIKDEHKVPKEGKVKGDVPDWIHGSLYRNGPGMYEVGDSKYVHLFDPLAMVQRFHIDGKKVTYQCHYLRSDAYKKNIEANRIVVSGFGTLPAPDPCKNIFQRFSSYFTTEERSLQDNTLVNVFPRGEELYAATEGPTLNRLDPETLDIIGQVSLSRKTGVDLCTAHPHCDKDGTIHNIGLAFKGKPRTCIVKIPPPKEEKEEFPEGSIMASFSPPGKVSINYNHSFPMTENYYIYIQQPLYLNFLKIITGKYIGRAIKDCFDWYPNEKTRFHIIDKRTGKEINPEFSYESDGLMYFHQVNAYEDKGFLVVDICAYKTNKVIETAYCRDFQKPGSFEFEKTRILRHVLPLNVSEETPNGSNLVTMADTSARAVRTEAKVICCTPEVITNMGLEFPQINYLKNNGKKYRYMYGNGGSQFQTLLKIDLADQSHKIWQEEKCAPSEPVFIPHPQATAEDDGVVLSAVNNTDFDKGQQAFLLILDAKTWTELARVTFDVTRFPFDFHGFFKDSNL